MKRLMPLVLAWIAMCIVLCGCGIQAKPKADGQPRLIAHGGGAVYGYRLTNSQEALDTAYENGFRYIELDFERTADGVYVLLHDWQSMAGRLLFSERVHTHSEFLAAETFQDLTLLDLNGLISWLDAHEGVSVVIDAKCENLPFLEHLAALPDAHKVRFIPQTYSYEEYAAAKQLGFPNVILTLYAMEYDETALLSFAEKEKPWAITIPEAYLSEGLLSALSAQGIVTYTHTVNDLSYYEAWRDRGLYGIYTDYFVPKKWID